MSIVRRSSNHCNLLPYQGKLLSRKTSVKVQKLGSVKMKLRKQIAAVGLEVKWHRETSNMDYTYLLFDTKQVKNIFRTIILGKMGASMVNECILIFS